MTQNRDHWLEDFPLSALPDTWRLNSMFLRKIDEFTRMWDAYGYDIKMGIEVDFNLLDGHEPPRLVVLANEFKSPDFVRHTIKELIPGLPWLESQVQRTQAEFKDPEIFSQTLNDVRDWLTTHPDAPEFLTDVKWDYDDAIEHLNRIENDLQSEDAETALQARRSVFMAHIHTRSFDQGGLHEYLEPRFGDNQLALGWYDCETPELRTKILSHPNDAIRNYHKFLHILVTESPKFGLVADLVYTIAPQIHVSLWRKSDGKNMMLMDDQESIDFCCRAAIGYWSILNVFSFMIYDQKPTPYYHTTLDFSAGVGRSNFIRHETDNWEIRRPESQISTHLARQLMLFFMGISYGIMHSQQDEAFQGLKTTDYLSSHPVVQNDIGIHISGLGSVLEHCSIDPETGFLIPDHFAIDNYIPRMNEEIGAHNLFKFKVPNPARAGLEMDLRDQRAWIDLFEKIRIRDDNTLDVSFLGDDSEIAQILSGIKITGRRNALHIGITEINTAPAVLAQSLDPARDSKTADIYFTPDEKLAWHSHYWCAGQEIFNKGAQYTLHEFFSTLNNKKNKEFSETEIFDKVFEQKFMLIVKHHIMRNTMTEELIETAYNSGSFDFKDIRNSPYLMITALRHHFKLVSEDALRNIDPNNPEHVRLGDALKRFADRVHKPHRHLAEDLGFKVMSIFNALRHEDFYDRIRFDTGSKEPLLMKSVELLSVIIFQALFDPKYERTDFIKDFETAYLMMPDLLKKIERQLPPEKSSPTVHTFFPYLASGITQFMSMMRTWIHKNHNYESGKYLSHQPQTISMP